MESELKEESEVRTESELSKQQKKNKKKKEAAKKKKLSGAKDTIQSQDQQNTCETKNKEEVVIKEPLKDTVKGEKVTSLSPEQQYEAELAWCCRQLEIGLTLKTSSKYQQDAADKALTTLMSNKASMIKKRQVMNRMFGDYRAKMVEEKKQMHKKEDTSKYTIKAENIKDSSSQFLKKHIHTENQTSSTQKPKTKEKL
eukprot:Ihof_evm8s143 gene=Ihof_evmTU8s143